MIEYEILGLHLEERPFLGVAKAINIEKIIRDQPKKLTNPHIELLKLKSKAVLSEGQFTPKPSWVNLPYFYKIIQILIGMPSAQIHLDAEKIKLED